MLTAGVGVHSEFIIAILNIVSCCGHRLPWEPANYNSGMSCLQAVLPSTCIARTASVVSMTHPGKHYQLTKITCIMQRLDQHSSTPLWLVISLHMRPEGFWTSVFHYLVSQKQGRRNGKMYTRWVTGACWVRTHSRAPVFPCKRGQS